MEIKQNKFLMVFSALTLLFAIIFLTYIIFVTTEQNRVVKPKVKEKLNVSITGSIDNTISIRPALWETKESSDSNPNISKIEFLVDTTNSTTTTAKYSVDLDIIELKDISNIKNIKWKLFNKEDLSKEILFGDFLMYSSNNSKINILNSIPISYGGNIDKYLLYIYLDETDMVKKEGQVEFRAKLSINTNK